MQTTMSDSDLQKRLEQLGRRLVEDAEAWERSTRAQRRDAVNHLAAHITQQISTAIERQRLTKVERRALKRANRAQRRAEQRARERSEASVGAGIVMLIAALGMAAFAAFRPELWWMIFVALGFGLGGAKQVSLANERKRAALPATSPVLEPQHQHQPGEIHEVDALCDQLLADLKKAPEAVQHFVQAPEKTIASLRATARALDTRRRQLLAEEPRERLSALAAQRQTLEARLTAASDPVTKAKLGDALRSLDGQRSALEELGTHADRVDGEYTSLLISLQELRTRVSVARSAGSAVQLDGVKTSVERLNSELAAISGALDDVSSERLQPIAPVSTDDSPSGVVPAGRERV